MKGKGDYNVHKRMRLERDILDTLLIAEICEGKPIGTKQELARRLGITRRSKIVPRLDALCKIGCVIHDRAYRTRWAWFSGKAFEEEIGRVYDKFMREKSKDDITSFKRSYEELMAEAKKYPKKMKKWIRDYREKYQWNGRFKNRKKSEKQLIKSEPNPSYECYRVFCYPALFYRMFPGEFKLEKDKKTKAFQWYEENSKIPFWQRAARARQEKFLGCIERRKARYMVAVSDFSLQDIAVR